jgi:hypothetical protein
VKRPEVVRELTKMADWVTRVLKKNEEEANGRH